MRRLVVRPARRLLGLIAFVGVLGGAAGSPTEPTRVGLSAAEWSSHVQVLASDAFGGRGPGTDGEERTVNYLREQFLRLGLAPGNGESFFQQVRVLVTTLDSAASTLRLTVGGAAQNPTVGEQAVIGTPSGEQDLNLPGCPFVFMGYGIHAPEHDWDDYRGVDVQGKALIVCSASRDSPVVLHLSYYARASYKYEEAARHGALAVLLVHDEAASGVAWRELASRWRQQQYDLLPEENPEPRLAMRGWLRDDSARSLFKAAGTSLSKARSAASRPGFTAVELGRRGSPEEPGLRGNIAQRHRQARGHQVPERSGGLLGALGSPRHAPERAGRQHLQRAIDNASGVASVLEIAAQFAAEDTKPERTVLFLLPTLEEEGLLGSKYYAAHPVVPLAETVADINFDTVIPIGPARDFVVVGLGLSGLDDVVQAAVAKQGRILAAEGASEGDHFFRSDQLSFARAGVPVLDLRGGVHSLRTTSDSEDLGQAAWNDFGSRYHRPNDAFDPHWDLRGIVPDLEIGYAVGRALASDRASDREWPNYREGSFFRRLRDAARGAIAAPSESKKTAQ